MTADPGPVVQLPHGDPVYAVWVWRQDSVTLARLRPFLSELVVMADAPCEVWPDGQRCAEQTLPAPCLACRVHSLAARMARAV